MKYQDIEVHLRAAGVDPRLGKVIQHLHAENMGLKEEIKAICAGLDRLFNMVDTIGAVSGLHQQIIGNMSEGKSMSEAIDAIRVEHLSDVQSEVIKP